MALVVRLSGIEQIGGAVGSTEALRVPCRRARRSAINLRESGPSRIIADHSENFYRELEARVDRSPKCGQQGDEQRSHPAREPYQSLAATTMATTRTEYSVGTGIRSILHSQTASPFYA